jgi:hypothetical protein
MVDDTRENRGAEALRAYVAGDSSEPIVISAFREFPFEERSRLMSAYRRELEGIDSARTAILESMLLPLGERSK